jgi:glycosyltransferase involved in cell wall biosynthesis
VAAGAAPHHHRDDVAAVLAAFDVLVCPSDHEPFGMVVLEALAAGRPVVASDSGGPAEILEHGKSGLLFRTGDPEALAAALLRLLADPSLARSLAEAGRLRVREAFARDRYARQMQEMYERLA